ncbi:hypothetical protein Salat_1167900 [Sesamum alatum]|uniref:Tf2-1-like SH3-like domain-containing protein n=1 Tax=Sesamum alatum TaxID=300844 RepID=A0AAE1YEB1_9LAMI|nr:hypothetical protein Salat_1167900 [Sesamum alatum]
MIGAVAYELELPQAVRIHPVFHVSLLKQCKGDPSTQTCPIPSAPLQSSDYETPVEITASRIVSSSSGPVPEVLIQWGNLPLDDATWEVLSDFLTRFPDSGLVDTAMLDGKRKVVTVPQPPAQVSSSQPLFKTQQVPPMHATGSSSQPQPPSHLGATYLPPSFWRGIGVSPQREIRSKNKNDDKELNSETCTQQ